MARRQQSPQQLIASLMLEEVGMTSHLSGGSSAQTAMGLPTADMSIIEIEADEEEPTDEQDQSGFTAQELKIAKRFIELMGGAERAREALDKCDECLDCLDLVDDEQQPGDEDDDTSIIAKMAGLIPSTPDLPTGSRDTSMLYNPSAMSEAM